MLEAAHSFIPDWRSKLARAGLVAKGALYIVLGVLAVRVAMGEGSSRQVTKDGAIETVAVTAITIGWEVRTRPTVLGESPRP